MAKRGEASPLVEEPPRSTLSIQSEEHSWHADLVPPSPALGLHRPIAEHADYIAIYSRIASAQLTLPVISTLALGACFSFYNYYGTAYSHLDASTFIGRLAQGLFLCATSVAAVCSVYSTTFFVLEAYYLQLIVSADEFNKGFNNENAHARRVELADDVAKLWGKFIPHRNAARSALWVCLRCLCENARARAYSMTERDAACARAACSSSRPRANWSWTAT